jgi:hypothetical protein
MQLSPTVEHERRSLYEGDTPFVLSLRAAESLDILNVLRVPEATVKRIIALVTDGDNSVPMAMWRTVIKKEYDAAVQAQSPAAAAA